MMSAMTIAARLNRHLDRFSATAAKPVADTTSRPRGDAARTSLIRHWPVLFILAGTAAMLGWIGAIVWLALYLLLWILG